MSTDLRDQISSLVAGDERLIDPVSADEAIERAGAALTTLRLASAAQRVDRYHGRRVRPLWSMLAAAAVVSALTVVVVVRQRPEQGASLPVESVPAAVGMPRAQDELARLVAAALAELGRPVALPWETTAGRSWSTDAEHFAEVRVRVPDQGELLVSIDTGDAEAAAIASRSRDVVRISGTASVFLGTDSDSARAVEVVDGTAIIYVRSESTSDALPLDDLAAVGLALNAAWLPDRLTFDSGGDPDVSLHAPSLITGA